MSNLHFLIFETANGFCGIAWSDAGIARLLLPAKTAEDAERMLRRRTPGAEPGVEAAVDELRPQQPAQLTGGGTGAIGTGCVRQMVQAHGSSVPPYEVAAPLG